MEAEIHASRNLNGMETYGLLKIREVSRFRITSLTLTKELSRFTAENRHLVQKLILKAFSLFCFVFSF